MKILETINQLIKTKLSKKFVEENIGLQIKSEDFETFSKELNLAINTFNIDEIEEYYSNALYLKSVLKDDKLPEFLEIIKEYSGDLELKSQVDTELEHSGYFRSIWRIKNLRHLSINILILIYRTTLLFRDENLAKAKVQVSSTLEEMSANLRFADKHTELFEVSRHWLIDWDEEGFHQELALKVGKLEAPKILFIHGYGTNAEEMDWMLHAKKTFERVGIDVKVPSFPNPQFPLFQEWKDQFDKNINGWCNPKDLTVIGHSLGAALAMMLANQYRFKELIAIAPGYIGHLSREDYYSRSKRDLKIKERMYNFFEDGGKIKNANLVKNIGKKTLIYSKDETVVKDYTKNFFVNEVKFDKYIELDGYGHFMTKNVENPVKVFKELEEMVVGD